MSDKAKNGSDSGRTSQPGTATELLDVKDLPSFSPTEDYLDRVEPHEVTAIGQGPEDATQERVKRAEREIKENEEKLKG